MITKADAVAAIEAVNELAYTQHAINMLAKAIAAINALPDSDDAKELARIKSGGEYICSCGLRKSCNHTGDPGF